MEETATIGSLFASAVGHHQAGRLSAAESVYRQILEMSATHPDANHNLGVIATQLGQAQEGLPFFMAAWESNPENEQYWLSLGECLVTVGRSKDAVKIIQGAISNGLVSIAMEKLLIVAQKASEGVGATPKQPPSQKELDELTSRYHQGRFEESIEFAKSFISRWPLQAMGWNTLVGSYAALNDLQAAEETCERAIKYLPEDASLHSDRGAILCEMGRIKDAEASCRIALELQPERPETMSNLGDILQRLGKLSEAEGLLTRALELKPDYPEAHNNLGTVLMDLGYPKEADESYQRALACRPGFAKTLHNRLFCISYRFDLSAEEIFLQYKSYGEGVAAQMTHSTINHSDWCWDGVRRLRIGYVGPDFRGHACRFFIEPFLREHDQVDFEVFIYSNMPAEDQHTERLKGYCEHWRDVFRLTDDAAAGQIVADKIDILVDLAGHTAGNRLLLFARKPAPIQVTYMGYDNTTGLKEIDYFLADEQLVPEGSESLFTEAIWRLPVSLCYEPPIGLIPEVGPLPALQNGFVTFGSMLRVIRLNDDVIRVWCEILKRVPNSCLRLYQEPFKYSDMKQYFIDRFARFGVDPSRILPEHMTPHWGGYNSIDIALDSFPNNGGATTLEALSMGVPVLTKRGKVGPGCFGASLLHPVGLSEWIVDTESGYVERAVAAAKDLTALAELRGNLRQRLEASPIQDIKCSTRNLEDAYRAMVKRRFSIETNQV